MPYFLPTTGHHTMWGGGMWSAKCAGVRLSIDISQEYINPKVKGNKMRVTFTMEVKAEIPTFDQKQREVFIRLMTEAAKKLYTQATLLSGNVSPDINVTVGDSSGKKQIDLFGEKK